MTKLSLLSFASAIALSFTAAQAQESEAEFNQRVYDALLANPLILDELTELAEIRREEVKQQQRQLALPIVSETLQEGPLVPVLGNPDASLTIFEFYDYNCGYCRRANPVVTQLLEEYDDVKFVFREFPILGETSSLAARASLAAYKQGKFKEFHNGMMQFKSPVSQSLIDDLAKDLGLDLAQMKADMGSEEIQSHIQGTYDAAGHLSIRGTPAFIIGGTVIDGFMDYDSLKAVIDNALEN